MARARAAAAAAFILFTAAGGATSDTRGGVALRRPPFVPSAMKIAPDASRVVERVAKDSRTTAQSSTSFVGIGADSGTEKQQGIVGKPIALFALSGVAFVALAILQSRGGKDSSLSSRFSPLTTVDGSSFAGPLNIFLFLLYSCLYLACATLGHYTRGRDYQSTMLILVSTLMKVVFAVCLWRAFDGTFMDMLRMAREEKSTLLLYVIPAACYTVGDTLRTHVLRIVEPATFLVLFNTRMFLLAFVWERLLGRKLGVANWIALILIFIGCSFKEYPHIDSNFQQFDRTRCLAYAEILAIGGINAFAAVYTERLLKFQSQVPVNLQNLAMYVFGTAWAGLGGLIPLISGHDAGATVLGWKQWRDVILDPLVVTMAFAVALLGVTTGFFLKRLSNIHREVAVGIAMVCSLPVDSFLFGSISTPVEMVGIGVVVIGVLVFAAFPVKS